MKSEAENGKNSERNGLSPIVPLIICSLPWLLLGFVLVVSPGYGAVFYQDPLGIGTLLGMMVWESMGFMIMWKAQSAVGWVVGIVVFVLPLLLVPMLGPAVFTILHALGPMI